MTPLNKFMEQTCNEVAEELIGNLSDFEVYRNHTDKHFDELKHDIQNRINSKIDSRASKDMCIDITQIQLNDRIGKRTLWEWAKNLSKIYEQQRNKTAIENFKREFYRELCRV